MLYGNETISKYTPGNVTIWMAMAFQAGLINIGAFLACHRFVSHVTGFATFFGHEVNQSDNRRAIGMLIVPLFFLMGCMLSAQLVDTRLRRHQRPRYYLSFGLIFLLAALVFGLGIFGFFGPFGEPLQFIRDYVLLVLLSLICGIQNATVTSVSNSVIRTTHLTGITTDLGIGLVRLFHRHRAKEADTENEGQANLMRIGIILFFCLGSTYGGFIFMKFQYFGFIVPVVTSGTLFVAMLYFQVFRRQIV
jgi:uncharacterized membrane protein YoaK (UPF0700 family)